MCVLLLLLSHFSHVRLLCDPIDSSPPGSSVPGILQARTLEWIAISFSNAWKWKLKVKLLSHVRFFTTPWTAAYQAPPSMGFSRQEYWSGVPLPSLMCVYKLIQYMIKILENLLALAFRGKGARFRLRWEGGLSRINTVSLTGATAYWRPWMDYVAKFGLMKTWFSVDPHAVINDYEIPNILRIKSGFINMGKFICWPNLTLVDVILSSFDFLT